MNPHGRIAENIVGGRALVRRDIPVTGWVRAQVRSCGICGGHSGTGAGFPRVLRFPQPSIPRTAPHSSSTISRPGYSRPVLSDVPSVLNRNTKEKTTDWGGGRSLVYSRWDWAYHLRIVCSDTKRGPTKPPIDSSPRHEQTSTPLPSIIFLQSSSSTVRNSSLCFTLYYTIHTTCFGPASWYFSSSYFLPLLYAKAASLDTFRYKR
jgi:hypothetical protein